MAITFVATVNSRDYSFDFVDQFIYTDALLSQIPIEDMYTAIKQAQQSENGIAYEAIASASGLDELDEGIQTFLTIRMFDEWEIRSLKSSGKVTTTGGNIVKDNGKDPFFDDGTIFYIAFFSQAGIKTTTVTGSGVTAQDKIDIIDGVWSKEL